jgi:hypothetical protein
MVAGLPPGVRLICDDRQTLCRKHSDECVARSGAMFIGNSWQADGHRAAATAVRQVTRRCADNTWRLCCWNPPEETTAPLAEVWAYPTSPRKIVRRTSGMVLIIVVKMIPVRLKERKNAPDRPSASVAPHPSVSLVLRYSSPIRRLADQSTDDAARGAEGRSFN